MGLAKLDIYVSGIDDPCGIDDRTWYIIIYNCDGSVFQWCRKRYVVLPARCGHLEVEVPPGCYYIKAVWGYTTIKEGQHYRANHFTDAAIVTACCESTLCVKLFNPSLHRCGDIYVKALKDYAVREDLDLRHVDRVAEVVEMVRERAGDPEKLFELGHDDEIAALVAERESDEQ